MDDSQLGNPWIVFEIVQTFWEGFFADVHIVKIWFDRRFDHFGGSSFHFSTSPWKLPMQPKKLEPVWGHGLSSNVVMPIWV